MHTAIQYGKIYFKLIVRIYQKILQLTSLVLEIHFNSGRRISLQRKWSERSSQRLHDRLLPFNAPTLNIRGPNPDPFINKWIFVINGSNDRHALYIRCPSTMWFWFKSQFRQ